MRPPLMAMALLVAGFLSPACKTNKPGSCRKDKDCKRSEHCIKGRCQQCGTDKHCGAGKTCVKGQCQPKVGYCDTHKDCPDGRICRDHQCQTCALDSECPNGRCEKGRCTETMSGSCREDDDCKDEEVCTKGRCVPAPKPYSGPGVCALATIHFEFNEAIIRKKDQTALEKNASCIKSVPKRRVHLNGHCDSRGTEEYNLALSAKRAETVKRYLETLGVQPGRLHVVPKGELEAMGEDDDGWLKDRRVEFIWY